MVKKYIMNNKFSQENIIANDIFKLNNMAFMDFEATSLGRNGFPIEVGLVTLGSSVQYSSRISISGLSNIEWSKESELIHGIKQSDLINSPSRESVAAELNHTFAGMVILVDDSFYDTFWARLLFESVNVKMNFEILTIYEYLYDIGMYELKGYFDNYKDSSYSHKALDDACYFRDRFINKVLPKINKIEFDNDK